MVPADPQRSRRQTRLARLRLARDLEQTEVARVAGLSDRTYQRLEAGELSNRGLRYLAACALVLNCRLSELIEDEWLAGPAAGRRLPQSPSPTASPVKVTGNVGGLQVQPVMSDEPSRGFGYSAAAGRLDITSRPCSSTGASRTTTSSTRCWCAPRRSASPNTATHGLGRFERQAARRAGQ